LSGVEEDGVIIITKRQLKPKITATDFIFGVDGDENPLRHKLLIQQIIGLMSLKKLCSIEDEED
jgi:hypothetical protein